VTVIIGVDPHKSTHTVVAIDRDERPLARLQLVAERCQTQRLTVRRFWGGRRSISDSVNPDPRSDPGAIPICLISRRVVLYQRSSGRQSLTAGNRYALRARRSWLGHRCDRRQRSRQIAESVALLRPRFGQRLVDPN
jgi:hypothetical protein